MKITNRSEMCRVYHADARQFHKFRTSEKVILYIYNPFAEDVLNDVLESCISIEVKGFFPNTTVSIFALGKSI